jgi:hypothetical protein
MRDDNLIFAMFVGCFAVLFLLVMHLHQQKLLVDLQTQILELKIIIDQKFLPALILDRSEFNVR